MKSKTNAARGGKLPAQFSTLYVVIDDSTGRVLTKPMGWNPASDWAASPLTKGAYLGGVTVVPASSVPDSAAKGAQLCECGAVAMWHGDPRGLREFCCEACWAVSGHNPERVAARIEGGGFSDFGGCGPELLAELRRLGFIQHGPGGWFLSLGSGLELWVCDGEGGHPGASCVLTLENAATGNGLFCERVGAKVAAGMLGALVPSA